jgi:DNA-binding XRE family transcriptional regulator
MTSEHVRAARALLRWEQKELAEKSGVSLPTIKRLETQPGTLGAYPDTVTAIRRALEEQGIEFQNGEACGVCLRRAAAAGPPASALKRPPRTREAPRKSSRPKRR